MEFLKLNGVKTLNKKTQQQIHGGGPAIPINCSNEAKNACMYTCMSSGNYTQSVCWDACFSPWMTGCYN